jgi:hypothetical protein
MRSTLLFTAAAALLGALPAVADDFIQCSLDNHCPEEAPCCSSK